MSAPSTAPIIGATQNSHSWAMAQSPTNTATPVLRAGLTEVLVIGIETRWISVSASPIGMPANPTAALLDVQPVMITSEIAGWDGMDRFTERAANHGSLGIFDAKYLIRFMQANAKRLDKFGA